MKMRFTNISRYFVDKVFPAWFLSFYGAFCLIFILTGVRSIIATIGNMVQNGASLFDAFGLIGMVVIPILFAVFVLIAWREISQQTHWGYILQFIFSIAGILISAGWAIFTHFGATIQDGWVILFFVVPVFVLHAIALIAFPLNQNRFVVK